MYFYTSYVSWFFANDGLLKLPKVKMTAYGTEIMRFISKGPKFPENEMFNSISVEIIE